MKKQGPISIEYVVEIQDVCILKSYGAKIEDIKGTVKFPPYRTYEGAMNRINKLKLNQGQKIRLKADIYLQEIVGGQKELINSICIFEAQK